MLTLYRADKRFFTVGDVIQTAGQFFGKFDAEMQLVETELERLRPSNKPSRKESLFLFEDKAVAEKHWSLMQDGKLYEVATREAHVLHKGDMQYLDYIRDKIRSGNVADDLYHEYWQGVATQDPRFEILVKSARIVSVISTDERARREFLRKRWGFSRAP